MPGYSKIAPCVIVSYVFELLTCTSEEKKKSYYRRPIYVTHDLRRFPLGQNFRFNRLKCKRNARINWEFSRTNGRSSEVLHFFRSTRLERKLPFHLHKMSISTACESACAHTNFLRHHDLPMRVQVFRPRGKSLSFLHGKFPEYQTENTA